jgi:hypothetical protein
LEELKLKLAKDFEGAPDMIVPEFMKTKNFAEMKARLAKLPKKSLPDFAARKATLQAMKEKLQEIRKTAETMDKPDKAFFDDVKKTLAESMDPKVAPFQLPELTAAEMETLQAVKAKKVPVEGTRFVENFGEELIEAREVTEEAHTDLLFASSRARQYMVEQVHNVFGSMVFDMARATEEMMRMRRAGQDLLDSETAAGADPECLAEFSEEFRTINYNFGGEMNQCATYAYYPARRYINSIFYPYMSYVVDEISSLHYLIMGMLSRSNVARDQESVLNVLDVLVQGERLRANMFAAEVLYWEGNAFADAHIYYINYMQECGTDLIARYTTGYNFVMSQYDRCRA